MAYQLGGFLGAALAILLLATIIERFAFKDRPPLARAQFTVGTAFVTAAVLAGFGKADGGPFVWDAGVKYLPGAALTFVWFYNRYKRAWTEDK